MVFHILSSFSYDSPTLSRFSHDSLPPTAGYLVLLFYTQILAFSSSGVFGIKSKSTRSPVRV